MSVNKHQPHVYVLPEDDANRQLANGFLQDPSLFPWKIRVLEVAGGWMEVLRHFRIDHIRGMEVWPLRYMVLLIDFDGKEDRLERAKSEIPAHLIDRVFVLAF